MPVGYPKSPSRYGGGGSRGVGMSSGRSPSKRSVLLPAKMRTNVLWSSAKGHSSSRSHHLAMYMDEFDMSLDEIQEVSVSESDHFDGDEDLRLMEEESSTTSSDDASVYLESPALIDENEAHRSDSSSVTGDDSSSHNQSAVERLPQHETLPESETTVNGLKLVRFAVDAETGEVQCQRYADFLPIRKKEYPKVWHQRADFARFRQENVQRASLARRQSSTATVAQFVHVYESCTSSKRLLGLTKEQTMAVSQSDLRGLEAAILQDSLVRNRKLYIQQVLQLQQEQQARRFNTVEERVEALAVQSRNWTKQSRRLAHVLGSGDAIVAQDYAVSSFLTASSSDDIQAQLWTPLALKRSESDDNMSLCSIHLCEV